jgi:O-antigen/teichoic acid export membrane protein
MVETEQQKSSVVAEIGTAIRHSAVYGLGNVVAKAIGFLMVPFYTHYLTPVDYGTLEILDLSMSLLGMLLNMGMTAALLRSYSAAPTLREKNKAVSTAFLFAALTGLLTFGAGASLAGLVSRTLLGPNVPSTYLLLAFSSFVLGYIANLPRTYLRALEASGAFVMVDTAALILMLGLNIYFIAVLKIGLVGILLSSVIAASLQVILLSIWTVKKAGFGFSGTLLRQMMGFGLPLIFSNMALFTLNFADRFYLKHFQSLDAVGIYAVGYKFAFMLNYLIVQPFFVMWQGRMYEIHKQPDHASIFGQIFMLYSTLLMYAGLALAVFSTEIVGVMVAPSFSASAGVIPVVTLAYIFCGIGYFTQLGMFLTNRTKMIGILSAGAAVLNLGLNYFLILNDGMLGAAWATLLSFAALAGGSYWLSQRLLPLPLAVGRAGIALVLAVGLYLMSRCGVSGSLALTVLVKIGLLVAYPLILWKGRVLSPSEISTLSFVRDSAASALSRLFGSTRGKAASA